ncbi:F-box protein SKIP [Trema orientale]|uniref:F-box protein SKIP n=1 Tax=Trema orientale TaxID=63057 RepID=A0A2P5BN84_TREOI|nr:F-box protein SKIP [Trema orientale]
MRHHHIPMLLVPSEEEHTWSIYNALDENFLELKLSLFHNKRFSGSSHGWLVIVNEDYTLTLHKPYFISKDDISASKTSVHLPCFFPPELDNLDYDTNDETDPEEEHFAHEDDSDPEDYLYLDSSYHVLKVLITADPLINPNDCTIVVKYGGLGKLAFIKYGKDTTWTKIEDDQFRGYEDMVYYKNQIYVHSRGKLASFDPCKGTIKLIAPTIFSLRATMKYLVESCGELLVVERFLYFFEDGYERITKMFIVFKFDFDEAKWIEIESLGDFTLFVGDNSSISISATEFNVQANCIYFTHDEVGLPTKTNESCDLGVYCLKSKSLKLYCNLDSTTFHRVYNRPPIWILPPNGY